MNTGSSQPNAYISTATAAELFGVKGTLVGKLARERSIDAYQKGRYWYVSPESLRLYLNHHRAVSTRQKIAKRSVNSSVVKETTEKSPSESFTVEETHDTPPENPIKNALKEAVAQKNFLSTHVQTAPLYAVHPVVDVLHRATALITAFILTFGLYTYLRPEEATIALTKATYAIRNVHENTIELLKYNPLSLIATDLPAQRFSINPYLSTAPQQVAASGSLGVPLAEIAKRFNREVNLFFTKILGI